RPDSADRADHPIGDPPPTRLPTARFARAVPDRAHGAGLFTNGGRYLPSAAVGLRLIGTGEPGVDAAAGLARRARLARRPDATGRGYRAPRRHGPAPGTSALSQRSVQPGRRITLRSDAAGRAAPMLGAAARCRARARSGEGRATGSRRRSASLRSRP